MKKFCALLLAAVGLFLLAGCSDSPKDVAEKWVAAIADGDLEKANSYSTENVKIVNSILVAAVKDGEKSGQEFVANKDKFDNATEEIDGDNAKVYLDGKKNDPITLKKVDGDWKVHVEK